MSNHTPEPWFTANKGSTIGADRQGLTFFCVGDNFGYENADRIVACVNALAGIPDPAAEMARLRAVEESWKEMVVALTKCVDGFDEAKAEDEYERRTFGGDRNPSAITFVGEKQARVALANAAKVGGGA